LESHAVALIGVIWFILWIAFSVFAVQFAFRLDQTKWRQLKGPLKWLAYYGVGFSVFLIFTIALALALVLSQLVLNAFR
jgi:hypothetical protein